MTTAVAILANSLERLNKISYLDEFCTVLESDWIVSAAELRSVVANTALWGRVKLPAILKLEIESVLKIESESVSMELEGTQAVVIGNHVDLSERSLQRSETSCESDETMLETTKSVREGINQCHKLKANPRHHEDFWNLREIPKKIVQSADELCENGADKLAVITKQLKVTRSVVRVVSLKNGKEFSTGFVISLVEGRRFVLTNAHGYPEGGRGYVQYDYNTDFDSSRGVKRAIIGEVWRSNKFADFSPFPTFGRQDFVALEITRGENDDNDYPPLTYEESDSRIEILMKRPVVMVGHPHGGPKTFTIGRIEKKSEAGVVYYQHNIPSCKGSSGSPIFLLPYGRISDGQRVVALHYGSNGAISLHSMLELIRTEAAIRPNFKSNPFPLLVDVQHNIIHDQLPK